MSRKTKAIISCIAAFFLVCTLVGCGVSDSDREKLYNAVIATGDLKLSSAVNEYEEKRVVSNAPVPGSSTYYTYKGDNGEKYEFEFQSTGSKEHPYRVKVHSEYETISSTKQSISYVYEFEKYKIINQMRLIDSYVSLYQFRFDENARASKCGISNFHIYNNEVTIYFDKDYIDDNLANYIMDYKSGKNDTIDIVVGAVQGDYSATKLNSAIISNDNIILKADINVEGPPEWVLVGETFIGLGKW